MGRFWRIAVCVGALVFAAQAAGAREVVVRAGESLSEIAWRELGSASRWREIARTNNLPHAEAIHPGQVLRIPEPRPVDVNALPAVAVFPGDAGSAGADAILRRTLDPVMDTAGVSTLRMALFAMVGLIIVWLAGTLLIRGGCWFSLVECRWRQALALSAILTAFSIAPIALWAHLSMTVQHDGPSAGIVVFMLVLFAGALATELFIVKGVLQCKWRSTLTILVMTSVLFNVAYLLSLAGVFGYMALRFC